MPGAVERTVMDDGSALHRRVSQEEIQSLSLTWELSEELRLILRSYLWYEGKRGAEYVEIPINQTIVLRVKQVSKLEEVWKDVKWEVKGKFEVEPIAITMSNPNVLSVWPATLPNSNGGSFSIEAIDMTVSQKMGYTVGTARGRFQSEPSFYTIKVLLDAIQYARFNQFYRTECGGMSGWFTFPIPLRGPARCRMISPPVETDRSSFALITFDIESETTPVMTFTEYLNTKDDTPPVPGYVSPGYVDVGYVAEN